MKLISFIILFSSFVVVAAADNQDKCKDSLEFQGYYGEFYEVPESEKIDNPYHFPAPEKTHEILEYLEGEMPKLEKRWLQPLYVPEFIKNLKSRAPGFATFEKRIDHNVGEHHWGVFRAVVDDDESDDVESSIAVKVGTQELDRIKYGLLMQHAFSLVGKAPAVEGIYLDERLNRLIQRFDVEDIREDGSQPEVAIAMEEVKNAWLFRHLYEPTPGFLPELDVTKIKEQLNLYQHLLDELRIQAVDVQFLITRESEVILIDFDRFQWKSRNGRIYGYFGDNALPFAPNNFQDLGRLITELQRNAKKDGPGKLPVFDKLVPSMWRMP